MKDRARNKDNIKARVLDASDILFASKGFEGTKIDDIADMCGITKSLIYYYFKDKEDILSQLIKRFYRESITDNSADSLISNPDDKDIVKEDFKRLFSFYKDKENIFKIMLIESIKRTKNADKILSLFADYFNDEMIEESGGDKAKRRKKMLAGMFMGFMPMVFFTIFEDSWARSYRLSKRQTRDRFSEICSEFYSIMAKNTRYVLKKSVI